MVDGNVGADNGAENALWYFREDVMVNSHHWFWHMTYPMSPTRKADRSGDLFYSMHHSLVARYNAERLSNGFNRVVPLFLGQGASIAEGYNPHLTNLDAAVPWTPRPAGTQLPVRKLDDRDIWQSKSCFCFSGVHADIHKHQHGGGADELRAACAGGESRISLYGKYICGIFYFDGMHAVFTYFTFHSLKVAGCP